MFPTESIYALVLFSGLVGGFGHCIGMCGPLAATFALSIEGAPAMLPLLYYNLGRVTTYGLLGGAVGVAGSLAGTASRLAGIQRAVAVGAGLVVAIMGLSMGGWIPAMRVFGNREHPARSLAKIIRIFAETRSPGAYYPLGMVLGLLPCGLVYTVLLSSARVGMEAASAAAAFLSGALLMALFGAGTLPSLLLLGKAVLVTGSRMRRRAWPGRALAALMVALGIVFAARGLRA